MIRLDDQLARLAHQVRQTLAAMADGHPLKRWFLIELEMLVPDAIESASMEELSARMRAVRQLQYMVDGQIAQQPTSADEFESVYTMSSRNPASHLEMVRRTNFSIEPQLLLEGARQAPLFDLVSPTAKVVGFLRSQDTALVFADCLVSAVEAQTILEQLGIVDAAVRARLSLLFRARYHTINAVVAQQQVAQVLEIASGISPRGLHWSREHAGTVYIESDLPALMRQKAKVMRGAIEQDQVAQRGVLHCCGLDALDLASLEHALEYTDPAAPLAIVTEGLLLYFNAAEMQQFFGNMRSVLSQRPQARWIVDMVAREHLLELCTRDPAVGSAIKSVFASTHRAVITANPFPEESSIHAALQFSGLRVTLQTLLAKCKKLPPNTASDVRSICGSRKIWSIAAA